MVSVRPCLHHAWHGADSQCLPSQAAAISSCLLPANMIYKPCMHSHLCARPQVRAWPAGKGEDGAVRFLTNSWVADGFGDRIFFTGTHADRLLSQQMLSCECMPGVLMAGTC